MTPEESQQLQQRVERLEIALQQIQETLQQLQSPSPSQNIAQQIEQIPNFQTAPVSIPQEISQAPQLKSQSTPVTPPVGETPPTFPFNPPPVQPQKSTFQFQSWEFWLNLIGISLVLFSLVFLFLYAIDRGWITPPVRVLFGLIIATLLLGLGFRLQTNPQNQHLNLSQVLLGGGIASYYITDFAAFQFFDLISYPLAFGFMGLITLSCFALSLAQNSAVLSVLAMVGGLTTPFMLYTDQGSAAGLVGYNSLLLAGSSAMFWRQRWRSLLWTSFIGGWMLLAIAALMVMNQTSSNNTAVQLGIGFAGALFAVLPVGRWLLDHQGDHQSASPLSSQASSGAQPGLASLPRQDNTINPLNWGLKLIIFFTPQIALLLLRLVVSLSDHAWGWVLLGLAALYGLAGFGFRKWFSEVAETHILVSFFYLALALVLFLNTDWLFLMLALEAAGLNLLARRTRNLSLTSAAHLFSIAIGIRLLERLLGSGSMGFFGGGINVVVIGLMAVGGKYIRNSGAQSFYLGFAHISFLMLLWRSLGHLGEGYITVAWGLYGLIMIIAGLRFDQSVLRWGGLSTLLLVVAKLFLIDLISLEPIWRILLFMGFGAAFLLLSYSFRNLWRGGGKAG
jgi:hypothetical protein